VPARAERLTEGDDHWAADPLSVAVEMPADDGEESSSVTASPITATPKMKSAHVR